MGEMGGTWVRWVGTSSSLLDVRLRDSCVACEFFVSFLRAPSMCGAFELRCYNVNNKKGWSLVAVTHSGYGFGPLREVASGATAVYARVHAAQRGSPETPARLS